MIKVAFCDDDLSVLKELSVLMDRYRVERNQDITYAAFHSPLDLLSEVERGPAGYYISGCSDAGTGWNQCRQRSVSMILR